MNDVEVARIESRLDRFQEANAKEHTAILKEIKDVNSRVRAGELWRAKMEGAASTIKGVWVVAAAGVGMLVGIGGAIVTLIVGG